MSDPLLLLDDVTVGYKNRRAPVLDRLSLAVEPSGFLAVVGPSGCGKSTLLHAIGGFLRPVSGSIRLRGVPVTEPGPQIGFMGQQYALFPWLTVEGNVAFGLRSKRVSQRETEETVDHLLNTVGLREYRRYYPEQLSGGMQQRAALARAMALRPALLLLDEPFSALDTETRRNMRDLLLGLWAASSTAIIFVTHDVEEAVLLGSRVLVLNARNGQTRVIDVPFPRPRAHDLEHTTAFRQVVEMVTPESGRTDW